MRKLATLPSLVALFFAPTSMAIGLGSIQLHSALGQPLQAEIPINIGQSKITTKEMKVKLSLPRDRDDITAYSKKHFKESDYKVSIVTLKNGKPSIRISSNNSLNAPYVRLTIDLKTPEGRLSREYTLLLDPPEFAAEKNAHQVVASNQLIDDEAVIVASVSTVPAESAPITADTEQTVSALPVNKRQLSTQSTQPRQSTQSTKSIQAKNRASAAVKTKETKRQRKSQHIFSKHVRKITTANAKANAKYKHVSNVNVTPQLLTAKLTPVISKIGGSTPRVKLVEEKKTAATKVIKSVKKEPVTTNTQVKKASIAPNKTSTKVSVATDRSVNNIATLTGNRYGPTQKNETLWSILKKLPKYEGVSLAQMQYAILKHNPKSFISGNVNGLKADLYLKIPTAEEVKKYNIDNVDNEIAVQSNAWTEIHQRFGLLLENSLEAVKKFDNPQANKTEIVTHLASVNKNILSTTFAQSDITQAPTIKVAQSDITQAPKTAEQPNKPLKVSTEIKSVDKFEAAESEYFTLITAMQKNIKGAINQLDELQQSQKQILTNIISLEAKQQNLENYLDIKNIELAQVEKRMKDVNLILTSLQSNITIQHNGNPVKVVQSLQYWSNNMSYLFGFGLFAGALLGGIWYLRRRQWKAIDEADELPIIQQDPLHVAIAEQNESCSDNNADINMAADVTVVEEEEEEEEESLSPLEEADVFITHKRFQQAEALLSDAIKHNPKRLDYYQKLLEVHAGSEDKDAFESTASYIINDLQFADEEAIVMINTLRALTWPDKPVADTANKEADISLSDIASSSTFTPPMANVDAADGASIELVQHETAEVTESTEAAQSSKAEDCETLKFESPIISTEAASDEVLGIASQTAAEDTPAATSEVSPELVADTSSANESVNDASTLSIEDQASDPSTALDLAKTYIELQDFESAIELLAKVEANGDASERKEASSLLRRIN